jgi:hypothetical protein
MKISIADLKKALLWIEVNTNESHVGISLLGPSFIIDTKDKYDQKIEIKLFDDNMMLPKIRKETVLK